MFTMDIGLLTSNMGMIPVTIVASSVLMILLVPRLLIPLLVRLLLLFSKFRYKRYVRLERNLKACYLERGSIETCKVSVFFLHGMSGSGVDFTGILSKFDENIYHVVTLDLLNHGSSTCLDKDVTVDDMVQFMKKFVERIALHRRKFHLVSFSMGTGIATLYTSKYPDDVASLTLCAPFCKPALDLMDFDQTFKDNNEMLHMLDRMSSNKMKHPPSFIARALVDHKNYAAVYVKRVQRGMRSFHFSPELLQKIEVDTYVLWGDEDKVCLIEGAGILKENIKHFKMDIIKDCGHVMFITHIDDVARHLLQWLSSQTEEHVVPRSQGLKPEMQKIL